MAGRRRISHNMVDLFALLLGAVALFWLWSHGQEFYETPLHALVDHPRYDELKSGGTVGKLLGAVATVMFFLNLMYLGRRRLRIARRLASLRTWMTTHVFFGLVGGGLIALHAVFRMTSEAARLAALALVALIVTGIVGRYIYAMVPHTASGEEEPEGLAGVAERALTGLMDLIGSDHPLVAACRSLGRIGRPPQRNLLLALFSLPLAPVRRIYARLRLRSLLGRLEGDPKDITHQRALDLARLAVDAGQKFQIAGQAGRILRSWRFLHLGFALLMLWAAGVHIYSAFSHGAGYDLGKPVYWISGFVFIFGGIGVAETRYRLKHRRRKVKIKIGDAPPPEPPPTLHPYIDPSICMGSAACVSACPEGDILGLLDGRSRLVGPTHCIGHGECARNCPVDAITLVFGTMRRGVDIPDVSRYFESTVPGIYLVGELTGMGLIRNAVVQANQAVDHLARQRKQDPTPPPPDMVDVIVVGAGPAGIAATLACMAKGLRTLTLEQEPDIGGAARHYPRQKLVMTAPMDLGMYGKVRLSEVSKEELIDLWHDVQARTGLEVACGVSVTGIEHLDTGFAVLAGERRFLGRRLMLAVGRRGTPRRLEVPGEARSSVVYTLLEPDQYRGLEVVVAGGGDSALEAACSLVDAGAAQVHLVHRRAGFDRARERNRARVQGLADEGRLTMHLERSVASIDDGQAVLSCGTEVPTDHVVVCVGGTMPTGLLEAAGAKVAQHFGRPHAQ